MNAGIEQITEGVTRFHGSASSEFALRETMIAVGASLGSVVRDRNRVPRIDRLVPHEAVDARPHSLSGQYGLQAFPLHSDLAQWPVPPRYLILAAAKAAPNCASTTFAAVPSLKDDAFAAIAAGIFTVPNGRRSFLASICQRDRPFIRFDSACMRPIDEISCSASATFRQEMEVAGITAVEWAPGDIVIVDNWHVLHGRASVPSAAELRVLLRLYVMENR